MGGVDTVPGEPEFIVMNRFATNGKYFSFSNIGLTKFLNQIADPKSASS